MGRVRRLACLGLALLFMLCGCATLEMQAGVDEENTAYLRYELNIDLQGSSQEQRARLYEAADQLLTAYSNDYGFTVENRSGGQALWLRLEKQVRASSPGEAFDALQAMLEDERQSLFTHLAMERTHTARQEGFYFSGTLDLWQLLALSTVGDMPEAVREELEAQFAAGSGTLTLRLPASEIQAQSGRAALAEGFATMEVPLSFTGETSLALSTRLSLAQGEALALPLEQLAQEQKQKADKLTLMAAAGGGLALLAVGLLFFGRRKR